MSRLQCSTSKYGDLTVVVATGDVDLATAGELWAELCPHLLPTAVVALECAGITFMDSMGLQVLMRTRQHAAEQQGSFALIGTDEHVDRALGLTGLTAVVPRFADVEAARAELRPDSPQ